MRRFLVLTTFLFASSLALCTALIGVARAQLLSPLPLLSEIKNCGGQVCFRGVIVGKTSFAEALNLSSKYPEIEILKNSVAIPTNRGNIVVLALNNLPPDQAKIGGIEINFYNGIGEIIYATPTLAEIIMQYGNPCRVIFDPVVDSLVLNYPAMTISFMNSDRLSGDSITSLSPSLTIGSIATYNLSYCTIDDPASEKTWHGLATWPEYGIIPP